MRRRGEVEETRLGVQILEFLEEAGAVFALPEPSADELADLRRATRAALGVIGDPRSSPADARRAVRLGARAQDLQHALHEHRRAYRDALLSQVQDGLRRLEPVSSSAELLDRVCGEAMRSCGLERILLSRVDGSSWRPWIVDFGFDRELEQDMTEAIRDLAIELDDSPIERAILAKRRPAMVGRVDPAATYTEIVGIARSTSYVVAPVAPAGRVVGLLHGDHGSGGPRVDIVDRDVLWVFAEGFGRIYERTELQERLRAQRQLTREAFDELEATIAAVAATEIQLGASTPAGELDGEAELELVAAPTATRASIDELLTAREREVLAQMVRGLNNAAIAERLAIREGTVKSHVKHILRKLDAVNRTDAISRYLSG
jgi:DNA-binding CsgD family transcriptional regulator